MNVSAKRLEPALRPTLAFFGGILAGPRDMVVRFRRAAWRSSVESILMNEHGWSLEAAIDYADTLEDIAEKLLANGTIGRFPTPREAIGSHKSGGSL